MRRARGFTLIELLITVAIVAILASAARPLSELNVKRAKELELRRALREIRDGLDAYRQAAEDGRIERRVGDSGYPRRLEDLFEGVDDRRAPNKQRIYFLRRLPRDPMTPDGQWGLRSYASPPDSPAPGDDVFDVYTLSSGVGINGRPYREW
ncbi:MAG TPA: type II secretion system protein [Burkholderiales bacterium]|nr:type II secretion system protein [Burkholderiales bacterium]